MDLQHIYLSLPLNDNLPTSTALDLGTGKHCLCCWCAARMQLACTERTTPPRALRAQLNMSAAQWPPEVSGDGAKVGPVGLNSGAGKGANAPGAAHKAHVQPLC
jgi:hypothetical protein